MIHVMYMKIMFLVVVADVRVMIPVTLPVTHLIILFLEELYCFVRCALYRCALVCFALGLQR